MHATVRLAVCLLALVSEAALAEGVPLITPAAPIAADDPIRAHWPAEFYPAPVKLHAVTFNNAAFGAPIVTVAVDGKTYTFTGGPIQQSPAGAVESGRDPKTGAMIPVAAPPLESWHGRGDDKFKQGYISLTKSYGYFISGSMRLPPSRVFSLEMRDGRTILVEGHRDMARRIMPRPEPPDTGSGVPLFIGPATVLPANSPIVRARYPADAYPAIVKVSVVNLNPTAFGAPVVTVVINGVTHTYRGSMMRQPPRKFPPVVERDASGIPLLAPELEHQAWYGHEDDKQGTLTLSKTGDLISATILRQPHSAFTVYTYDGQALLAEGDLTRLWSRRPRCDTAASGVQSPPASIGPLTQTATTTPGC